MAEKNGVKVITDSIACIPNKMLDELDITVVPSIIYFGDKNYRDGVDLTPDEAYQMFLINPDEFKTSPASAGSYLDAYRKAARHANNILCLTLSSKLSTCYSMACMAMERAKEELPETTIKVFDCENVTAAQGFVVLSAARAAAQGKSLYDVIKAAEKVKKQVTFFILLDTIKHVYRTGRIPKPASNIGAALSIKPILTISSGAIQFTGMTRNHQRGLDRIIQLIYSRVGRKPLHAAVMHAYAPKEAETLKERIAREFNCVELWATEFSPIMGYACGTGTVGVAFYSQGDNTT